jgi:hypothetical protein
MPKRATLDTDLFKVELPTQPRNPLDSLIPTTPPTVQKPAPKKQVQAPRFKKRNVPKSKNERQNEPTFGRTNVRTNKIKGRIKIRHSFDIYQDQLFELQALQLAFLRKGKSKMKLGVMVQEAIDMYLEVKKVS